MKGITSQTDTLLLTVNRAAKLLSAHPETVRRWIRQGKLSCVRLPGGMVRISTDAIEALVNASEATAAGKNAGGVG